MKRIIITMILTLSIMSVYCYGWFYANWPCLLYDQCPPPLNSNQSSIDSQNLSPSLGQLSIYAAGFFLQSNSDYQAFLKEIEITPLKEYRNSQGTVRLHISNYDAVYGKLKSLIEKSIENMAKAQSIYYRVWQTSMRLERDPVILEKLANFDYQLILEEKRLIASIFQEVEYFLKHGNMKGAFELIFNDTGDIIQGMKSIKSLLEANSIDISQCWQVNQQLLKSALFGQYISQVFSEIRKSNM